MNFLRRAIYPVPLILAALPGFSATAPATSYRYIAIVVDTSGSMRTPAMGQIPPSAIQAARDTLSLFSSAARIRIVDADGNGITNGWKSNTPALQADAVAELTGYHGWSGKDPGKAIKTLLGSPWEGSMYICVIGDEWLSAAGSNPAADIAALKPVDPVRIGGIQILTSGLPTPSDGNRAFNRYLSQIATSTGGAVAVLDANPVPARLPATGGESVKFRMLQLNRGDLTDAQLRAHAEMVRDRVVSGKSDIVSLIKELSSDPRAATGGEYPTYAAGDVTREFRGPVFDAIPGGLQPGEITAPIIRPEAAYLLYIVERNGSAVPSPAAALQRWISTVP